MTFSDRPWPAQNPWYCGTMGPLPRRRRAQADVLRLLARRLHDWPDHTPLRLHDEAERLRRVLDTLAGYPEIAPGSLPFDQPFRVEAAEALELALTLDDWPPLAGRHSLRTELLWLDRVQRSGLAVAGLILPPAQWLQLVVAWLIAGVSAAEASEPDADIVLLDLLYDPEERADAGGAIRGAASLLAGAALGRRHRAFARLSDDPRHDKQRLGAAAEWLWWCRQGAPLAEDDPRPRPRLALDESRWTVEVTFHRIQAWMTTIPGGSEQAEAEPRLARLYGGLVRGASDLLEATMSALRSTLLGRLGPGALLVDGGARLCFRCAPGARAEIEVAIHRTIDELLAPAGGLGRRYAGILALLTRQAFLSPPEASDVLEQRRRLAWSALPPLSVTFVERPERAAPAEVAGPVRVPVRRRWPMPIDAPPPASRLERRREFRLSLPTRLRVEIGVLAPRERLLRVRFRDTARDFDLRKLPSVRAVFRQLLVADLNRVGALLSRPREGALDPEAAARRSFRFTAHWLSAVTRAVVAFDETNLPEVLVLGGDDLVVGTRLDQGDLRAFAARLHSELGPLNAELPPCDGVSFSAGLVTTSGQGTRNQHALEAAYRLKDEAKSQWRRTIDGVAPAPFTGSAERLAGEGALRSSLVLLSPAADSALSAGPAAGDGSSVASVRDLGHDVDAWPSPFSRLALLAQAAAPDLLQPREDPASGPSRRFELLAEGAAAGGRDRLALIEYEVLARPRWSADVSPCAPCAGRGPAPGETA